MLAQIKLSSWPLGSLFLASLFTAAAASAAPPDVPAVVGASGVSAHQVNVSWSPALGVVQPASYNIYRNGQYAGSIPGIPNNSVYKEPGMFQDVGLNPNTTYSYTVRSVSSANEVSAASMAVNATTLAPGQTGIIPPIRLFNWRPGVTVGVPGGIPNNRSHMVDVTQPPHNADNTGTNDSAAAISNAIAQSAENDVIYLPPGRYKILSQIYINAGKRTLRGAGINNTTIDCRAGTCIFLRGGDGFYNAPSSQIVSGLSKGTSQVTLTDGSSFQNGTIVLITTEDRNLPVMATSNGYFIRGQTSIVTAKSANTLTIDPPLHFNLNGPTARILAAPVTLRSFGVEDMTIDGSNALPQIGISMLGNYGSWIKNVKIKGIGNYTVSIADSHACEMRHSYLDELNHAGSNGAGLLMNQSGGCLIEDNIVYKSFPLLEINTHSSGNVFSYNFMTGNVVDTNHGPHNSYNLYEGNLMDGIMSDAYFGSESEGTFFRNWITGKAFPVALKRFSRNFSIVGNQIGESGGANGGYSFGQPYMGNGDSTGFVAPSAGIFWADINTIPAPGPIGWPERDLDVLTTTILKVNWYSGQSGYYGGVNESLQSGETLPDSLYLTSRPAWFGNLAWPPFNPTSPNQNYDAIPAGYRYNHGGVDPPGVAANPAAPISLEILQ